ncbi:MAG: outer membrane lipoprotein-sorting protein [Chrysiogenales bacterium]|nr:MAG: outer membrane lipoprotein-sorting protein [Chrysiogenales bacterium]
MQPDCRWRPLECLQRKRKRVRSVVKTRLNERIRRIVTFGMVMSALLAFAEQSVSQEDRKIELNAQGILARVDKIMEYPRGQIAGNMKHIRPDGSATNINFTGFITEEDYLFTFKSRDRGEMLKVLYNLGGEGIWVYNIHALKLFHKLGIDKYDEILSTNYSYIDLSNADYQSNYTATIDGDALVKGIDVWRLILKPILKGGSYGMLTLYVTKDRFIPIRIDFHDRDKAIFKFMTIVNVRESEDRIVPLRYDMMNIRQGTVTIFNFSDFEEKITFKKDLFRPEKLGE